MPELKDEYAKRAFENISKIASGSNVELDELDVIAAYFGIKDSSSIKKELKSDYFDNNYDIKSRRIKLEKNWFKNAAMPMHVKTVDDGIAAVIPDSFGNCRYYKDGKFINITKKNVEMFSTEAVCFYKGFGNGRLTVKELLKYMLDTSTVKDKIMVIMMSILVTATGMIFPFANYMIFNYIIPSGTIGDILPVAALLAGITGMIAAAMLMQSTVLTNVISKMSIYVQGALFSRLMRLKTEFFKKQNIGELSKIAADFSDVGGMVSAQSLIAAIGLVLSIAYIVQMHSYAPELLGAVLIMAAVIVALAVREAVLFVRWKKDYTGSEAELSGFVYEFFSYMEKIKLNGASTRMFERWTMKYSDSMAKRNKPVQLKYSQAISKAVELLSIILIFIIGAKANMPMANYIAFNSAYGSFIVAVAGIGAVLESAAMLSGSIKLLKPVLDADTEHISGKKTIGKIKGSIEISNLHFGYAPNLPEVINGLNLKIDAGESIGIVGSSGCGKSTLLRLLLGFEEAVGGGIFIDGIDIKEIDIQSYRKQLGIVLQDSRLLNDDIYSNITITAPWADSDDVWRAVENAGLTEDIEQMPMGLRTIVSEENPTISGGQKQRILIARSIVSNPPILIFDEATSALDNITQEKVINAVEKLNSTRIMIAHRLSTIKSCDRIIYLDNGQIAEEGTYDALMEKRGLFYNMAKRQTV